MDIKYNAFVSYRHHPDDIRAATEIHRGLERFKVPRAIRKRSAGISRIFRDKDELPITSSLTDDITRALKNSDYLIVICSVHTKESVWVQREIETFLSTHDRSKVLTVLVNGEPYDVIPEILLYEDAVDPISGETRRIEYEPLSCDWRMKRKKAVREELPRLAAALLGCGYDELRQRQRQYRTRRMAALFSAATAASLCLAAYFLHTSIQIQKANDDLQTANEEISAANAQISAANEEIRAANEEIQQANIQIQENLDEALRNQSQYLASSAQEHLESGDRLTAIALALAALPGEGGERPYVPQAELSLSNALRSYVSDAQASADGAFDVGALIDDFCVTDDGGTIYITDSRETVTVWDTHSFRKLATIDAGGYTLQKVCTTPGGNVLLWTGAADGHLFCYGPDGVLRWQEENCRDSAYLNDEGILMVLSLRYPDTYIKFLHPETGEALRPELKLSIPEGINTVNGFYEQNNSQGRPICIKAYSGTEYYILTLDASNGELFRLMSLDTSGDNWTRSIDCVTSDDRGCVYAMVSTGSGIYNGNYGTFSVTSPAVSEIFCYEADSGRLIWQSEITAYTFGGTISINPVPNTGLVLCQYSNIFQLHDAATGDVVGSCDTLGVPLTVNVDETSTWGILDNGTYFVYEHARGLCFCYPFMDGAVARAQIANAYFVLPPLGTQVTVYRSVKDDSGQVLQGDYSLSSVDGHLAQDELLAVVYYKTLYLFDIEEKSLVFQHSFTNLTSLLSFSGDGGTLWMWDLTADSVIAVDTENGHISTAQVPCHIGGEFDYTYYESELFVADGALLYILETRDETALIRYELSSGSHDQWPLPQLTAVGSAIYNKSSRILGLTGEHIWFWREDGSIYRLDTESGRIDTVLTDAASAPIGLVSEGGDRIALAVGSEITLMDDGGQITMRTLMDGRKGVSLCFYGDELLVLCDDGIIYRYAADGTLLSQTTLSIYSTFSSRVSLNTDPMGIFWHFTGDGDLIVGALNAGNIIDCGGWQCRAFVPHLMAYGQNTDELVSLAGGQLVLFHRYSTQEQIERAYEQLNGYTLSDEQKQDFGID